MGCDHVSKEVIAQGNDMSVAYGLHVTRRRRDDKWPDQIYVQNVFAHKQGQVQRPATLRSSDQLLTNARHLLGETGKGRRGDGYDHLKLQWNTTRSHLSFNAEEISCHSKLSTDDTGGAQLEIIQK